MRAARCARLMMASPVNPAGCLIGTWIHSQHAVLRSKLPGLQPFKEFTSQKRMAAVVDAFLAGLPRTTVLEREEGKHGIFWHARVLTRLWGFADDFFVRVSCEAGLHQSTVEMQVRGSRA